MYVGDSAPLGSDLVEQAGTLDFDSLNQLGIPNPTSNGTHTGDTGIQDIPRSPGEEQALEWHEVIELQAFSERKVWIEEKTKFLEQMPPIEVFTGLDAVRRSAEEVPGLPTRAELEQWMLEHDKIEKETELFDSGELKKLKKFTKAATQRNLSPADTDLIELTLTTIYEFDKLLHLLRDRSDNLELLSIRLTWEERRISAWHELRSIIADLRNFLNTRSRWSPTIYDNQLSEEEDPPAVVDRPPSVLATRTIKRKGSVVSLASSTSDSIFPSLVMSRSERFKLAERLSRDAAQFSSRVASLKHSKINAAGKALDRLIDASREPVPEELLDEQDRLEDQGINSMEDIGKFVMSVVMQWKKADEIYVETIKDKNNAQTLLEEIETAKMFHPTSRQDSAFLARITTLMKRLEMRGDPSLPTSSFPRPLHPLFEDQDKTNTAITELLTDELVSAMDHAKRAELAAKEYHATFEVVKKVEALSKSATDLSEQLGSLIERLNNGSDSTVGDASPPDLMTESCLQPSSHSVYLSLLPALLDQHQRVDEDAAKLLQTVPSALLDIGRPGIDTEFASYCVAAVDRLDAQRSACARARDVITHRVSALHRIRDTWTTMAQVLEQLDDIRCDLADALKMHAWKSQAEEDAALLTPESPSSVLVPDMSPDDAASRLDAVQSQLQVEVMSSLDAVSSSLGPGLKTYLESCSSGLTSTLDDARRMANLLVSVQRQAEEMSVIRDETHSLQMRLEECKVRLEDAIQNTLTGDEAESSASQKKIKVELGELQQTVQTFTDDLPRRVSFVSRGASTHTHSQAAPRLRRRFSVSGFSLDCIQQVTAISVPLDLANLDRTVRADVNTYSMLLAGAVASAQQKDDLLDLSHVAREIDDCLVAPANILQLVSEETGAIQSSLDERSGQPLSLEELSSLSEQIDQLYPTHGPAIVSSLSTIRGLLDRLQSGLSKHDPAVTAAWLNPRRRQLEDVDERFKGWKESVEVLSERISDIRHLEQVRIAEAARQEAERQKIEEERKAKARQELLEQEEQTRAEEARLKAEQERLDAEAQKKDLGMLDFPYNGGMDEDMIAQQSVDPASSQELSDSQACVRFLRRQIRSLDIGDIARADTRKTTPLPNTHQCDRLEKQLSSILSELDDLPSAGPADPSPDTELRCLRSEASHASEQMGRIRQLARLASSVESCDNALSDLLEHVDSFPAPPVGPLASSYISDTSMPPEEQLTSRLSFTRDLIDEMVEQCAGVANDARAKSERERILQTWDELQAMGTDRLHGQKSRPASVISSGRSSRASAVSSSGTASSSGISVKKGNAFPRRDSVDSVGHFLAPPVPHARRVTSAGSVNGYSRSSSRASMSTKRSVSGPMDGTPTLSRLQSSTFASRQRSSSVTSNSPPSATPTAKKHVLRPPLGAPLILSRPRAQTAHSRRAASPAISESSARSRSSLNMSQSSASRSSWARAARPSFPLLPKASPPRRQSVRANRPYVPNPKNKLDVALGDVVNSLPVNINIEVVEETWRDQSGKYWIGDDDPKLCFCRILRSQTVMVRVGGGWAELSKFIKEHFAEAFRLLPDSPPRARVPEEKWISSASLVEAMKVHNTDTPTPLPSRTPEPRSPRLPSFAISTPSPKSVDSSSGSPLRAIQFIRRAERDSPILRAETPTRAPRHPSAIANTPRQPVWRP